MAQNPAIVNQQMRAALLATGLRQRKNLGTFTLNGLGQTTRIKLFNVGLLTRLCAFLTIPITIGTATATPSPKAPYNYLTRVRVTDFDGTDRINVSGWQLFVITCVRNRQAFGYNNSGPIFDANGSTEKSGIIINPTVPTVVSSASILYYLEIPIAFDPESDLRGGILTQTGVGEMYLSVDVNSSLILNGNDDSVYDGAGTTTVVANGSATMQVWQEYLFPQNVGGQIPLPQFDLLTVYELNGSVRSSDNIAVGSEKLINYPNVRSVIGIYANYFSNSLVSNALTQLRMIVNGNNVLLDYNNSDRLIEQRMYNFGDVAKGAYWLLHRSKPIETALLGNVQLGFTPSAAAASPYLEIAYEDFFTKGAQLPGLAQSS
jgi:hypothetical protein